MKYLYLVVDTNSKVCLSAYTRKEARSCKKICQDHPMGDVPPFRIIQLDVSQGKVVR